MSRIIRTAKERARSHACHDRRGRGLACRVVAHVSMALAAASAATPVRAGPHVRVRGAAHIDAHATLADGQIRLEATLTDDANAPLEGERVAVSLSPTEPLAARFELERCWRAKADDPTGDSILPLTSVRTDEGGRLCVATKTAVHPPCVARLEWRGSALIEGAARELEVDPSRSSIELRFDPEPAMVSLDRGSLDLDAVASFANSDALLAPPPLTLALTNELGAELGFGTTDARGRTRFVLAPGRAGPPGRGELRVAFHGDASTAGALHAAQVERHARVTLSPTGTGGATLPPGTPEEGVSVIVSARTRSGEPVQSGSVEAHVAGNPVGAATIANGYAKLLMTFSADEGALSEIRLRYHPSTPWYEPGDEIRLGLPVVPPSRWRGVLLAAAGLAVVAWLLIGRAARTASFRPFPGPRRQGPSPVEARITVRSAGHAHAGWTGHVLDAHDGTAIRGATIEISRDGLEPLARATTDESGYFELTCDAPGRGHRIGVSSRLHATLYQSAPALGEIEVALVLRRRALLERFVAWARDRGAPFDATQEPTPAQVALATLVDPHAARWAWDIERAVFGPEEVDEKVERDLVEAAPPSNASPTRRDEDFEDTPR